MQMDLKKYKKRKRFRFKNMIKLTNEDNMALMARYPDGYFELAIVDPPYGIEINMNMGRRAGKRKVHIEKNWDDEIPEDLYFNELFRVSKNQIIWGGELFPFAINKILDFLGQRSTSRR